MYHLSDIHAGLYSFSFDPNYDWTRGLAGGEEIRRYVERIVEKYHLRPRMTFSVEWLSAKWDESRHLWTVELQHMETGKKFIHECRILYSAVGQLVTPRKVDIPGISTFKGEIFHTARWRKDISLKDKNVVIVGNGCMAIVCLPIRYLITLIIPRFGRSSGSLYRE